MYSVARQFTRRALANRAWLPAPSARALVHTTKLARQQQQHEQQQQQNDTFDGEATGVDPEVSPYAIGLSTFFVGCLSYYLYSEYGHAIKKHLPWNAASNATAGALKEAEEEARKQARRERRMRAKLVPTSEFSALEQVNWAWSNPGLYAVGSNEYGLVDPLHPGSGVGFKAAVPGLEGKIIRDAAFAKAHAAAIDANGCLYQWGTGFTGTNTSHRPIMTLKDPSIRALVVSDDYVVALDKRSRIRLIRGNNETSANHKAEQVLQFEPKLGWRENVVTISAGKAHLAATTSYGNVYTCALDSDGNSRYQLGHGPDRQAQDALFKLTRVDSEKKFSAAACGAQHTLLLTTEGEVLGVGANDFGQLCQGDFTEANSTVSELTPLQKLWKGGVFRPDRAHALQIAAGGATSYIEVEQDGCRQLLSCGSGINGQLGNSTLAHMQGKPAKVAALSDQQEFDAESGTRKPVGIRSISAANDHVVVVRDNSTNVKPDKSGKSVLASPLYGYDVLVWGQNSSGQCIPDRKHRFAEPEHPAPLYNTKGGGPAKDAAAGYNSMASPRLQAAPSQWVPPKSFKNTDTASASSAPVLVEQAFVAGHSVTAAFLRPSEN
ncbi:hypothetical protein GGI12_001862 [Dipsacomyces acuminosporus]|nr:hypothetical protein GGI12_001862 [Dipsacomyces acuminosporus]